MKYTVYLVLFTRKESMKGGEKNAKNKKELSRSGDQESSKNI